MAIIKKMVLGWALALAGCSAMGPASNFIQAPKISIQDASVQNISLMQGTGLVTLQITNPNPVPIPLEGVQYNLRLNGAQVASGAQRQSMHLMPNQPMAVQIPIQLNLQQIMQLAPNLWRSQQVQYELDGAVQVPYLSIPFQRQGEIGVQM
ncbi:LEA type 2 family protein [Thiolinea disciformis]|uniref:LEA type 2 family protein n=1 Tax=Thiolinea disciformis TaxID=125614 RepID=UPI00035D7111|nr:LEA type 2 family protein [Thiolinea disciformis]